MHLPNMEFLTKDDIVQFNEMTIQEHGGNFVPPCNFLNENSLDYLLEAVGSELFGQPMYPSISDKAAFYMFSIVTGHIFQDGNKRTGLEAALLFLKLNGAILDDALTQIAAPPDKLIPSVGGDSLELLENFTIEMASSQITLDEARQWFAANAQTQ